jgi:L-serine dehydratase
MGLLDMIGPVMIGPSSSHTAGAVRLGLLARDLLGETPRRAHVSLHGSFAKTGRGHGTHLAVVSGLLGSPPDDPELTRAFERAERAGLEVTLAEADLGEVHPNSALFEVEGATDKIAVAGSSTGGGAILVYAIDGYPVRISGEYFTIVTRHRDTPGAIALVAGALSAAGANIANLHCLRGARGVEALMTVELDERPPGHVLEGIRSLEPVLWFRTVERVAL